MCVVKLMILLLVGVAAYFIVKDMMPLETVQRSGFLRLMNITLPLHICLVVIVVVFYCLLHIIGLVHLTWFKKKLKLFQ